MKNFIVSVVASLVASLFCFLFSILTSAFGWTLLFAVLCGILLLFSIYLIIANKCSTNPLKKLNLIGCKIRIDGRDDVVYFECISLVRPNYIRFKSVNGVTGYAHHSKVILFI